MNIYDINRAIENCITEEGEVIDEQALTELLMAKEEKIENVACWIKNLTAEAEAIKAEKERLAERQKKAEEKTESLKKWLAFALEGEKFTTARVAISYRKSVSVQVDESLLDKKYMKEKVTYTPDKTALKKALQAGENIEGAYLEEKQNIQIK